MRNISKSLIPRTFLNAIAVAEPGATAIPSWNGNGCCFPSTITTLTPASSLSSLMYCLCSMNRSSCKPLKCIIFVGEDGDYHSVQAVHGCLVMLGQYKNMADMALMVE